MNADDTAQTAILAGTAPLLRTQGAAITLRIWHHLASDDDARLLLFEPFWAEGRPYSLIEAVLSAAETPVRFAQHLSAEQIRTGLPSMSDALAGALRDLLGAAADARMIPAWRAVLETLLETIAARADRRSA
ncbi:hemoglobin-like flavoprotein [Sphingomonas vulcanisoli]|uniref:Hemoglobin-like flavoprotein n=1 Tax=Sphingomonas vulcanisoli TaxID=1658060 RepID=A0ABX0TR85_9SPHN|nr:hypothetical protein [Sphingomonas vulcanisoli]NIJ06897.1 hemoglobin-like flavoprotein [Sphingomonas vulcanisoli]